MLIKYHLHVFFLFVVGKDCLQVGILLPKTFEKNEFCKRHPRAAFGPNSDSEDFHPQGVTSKLQEMCLRGISWPQRFHGKAR